MPFSAPRVAVKAAVGPPNPYINSDSNLLGIFPGSLFSAAYVPKLAPPKADNSVPAVKKGLCKAVIPILSTGPNLPPFAIIFKFLA